MTENLTDESEIDSLPRKEFVEKLPAILARRKAERVLRNTQSVRSDSPPVPRCTESARDLVVGDHEAKLIKNFLDDKRAGNRWSYGQKPFPVCFNEDLLQLCLKYPNLIGPEFSNRRRQLIDDLERVLTFAASPTDLPMPVSDLERAIHTNLLVILQLIAAEKSDIVTSDDKLAAHEELRLQRTWNANPRDQSLATY
jgi:hypothetical protein